MNAGLSSRNLFRNIIMKGACKCFFISGVATGNFIKDSQTVQESEKTTTEKLSSPKET